MNFWRQIFFSVTLILSTAHFAFAAEDDSLKLDIIDVTKSDRFCESGFDLDSCSYIPLYNELYDWLGVPYKYAGHTKKGVDCSSFVKIVLNSVFNTEIKGNAASLHRQATAVKKKDLKEGDLVFFDINKGYISHIGIYLGNGYFAHASCSRGVMLNNLSERYYKKYFKGGGRIL